MASLFEGVFEVKNSRAALIDVYVVQNTIQYWVVLDY